MFALAGLLALSSLGFTFLPWPDLIGSGWLVSLLMIGSGMAMGRVRSGSYLPDTNRPRSVIWFGAGALLMQAAIHAAAIGGL